MENEKKPKKRTLRLLIVLTVVLLLAFMAVPAFAAENEEHTLSGFWRFNEVLTPYGLDTVYEIPVNFTANVFYEPVGEFICSCSGFRLYNDSAHDGGFKVAIYAEDMQPPLNPYLPEWLLVYVNGWRETDYLVVDFGIEPQPVSSEFYIWFTQNAVPVDSFRDSVTSGLTVVIDWVGAVVSSLFFGELSGLLPIVAIPVAVTLLVLAIYFIRRSIWGA